MLVAIIPTAHIPAYATRALDGIFFFALATARRIPTIIIAPSMVVNGPLSLGFWLFYFLWPAESDLLLWDNGDYCGDNLFNQERLNRFIQFVESACTSTSNWLSDFRMNPPCSLSISSLKTTVAPKRRCGGDC